MIKEILRGLLKAVVGTVAVILTLYLLFQLLVQLYYFSIRYPGRSDEMDAWFEEYKYDFNVINNYIIKNFGHMADEDDNSLMLVEENGYATALYDKGENILLPDELVTAFRNVDEAFKPWGYDSITITKERISYEGLGKKMFVYSRNGKIPNYFYSEDDGIDNYSRCILPDNWYLLEHNVR